MGRPRTLRPQLRRDSLGSSDSMYRCAWLTCVVCLVACGRDSDHRVTADTVMVYTTTPSTIARDSMAPTDSLTKILAAYYEGRLGADAAAKALFDEWDRGGYGSINLEMDSELRRAISREAEARRPK